MTGTRVVFLKRSFLVLILMAITVITGMATGFGMFYRLLYVLGLTAAIGYVWTWLSVRSLDVSVNRGTLRLSVGDNLEERIKVLSLGRWPRTALLVEDLTDLPGYSSGRVISLGPGANQTWTTSSPARKRGIYSLGPLRVTTSDPFAMFRAETTFGRSESLIVLPRTFDLPDFTIPAADLSGDSALKKRAHDLTPHAASVREYASGDSLSRVHWASTARLGKLMSKEFDLGQASNVWIVADLQSGVQAGELEESTDEYAVSIGASLAKRYLEAGMPVGMIIYGDQRYHLPPDTGAGQFDRIMEDFAMSKAEGTTPLADALARDEALWTHHSSVLVITSSPRPEWVRVMRELSRRRIKVAAVVVDGASFGALLGTSSVMEELYAAGVPAYVVRQGDHIPTAMARTQTGGAGLAAERSVEAEVAI